MCQQTHSCVVVSVGADQMQAPPTSSTSPAHGCGKWGDVGGSVIKRRLQLHRHGRLSSSRRTRTHGKVHMRLRPAEEGERARGKRKDRRSAGEERGRRTSLKNPPGPEKIHEAKNSICHFVCDGGARRQHVTRHIRRTQRTGILGYISSDI